MKKKMTVDKNPFRQQSTMEYRIKIKIMKKKSRLFIVCAASFSAAFSHAPTPWDPLLTSHTTWLVTYFREPPHQIELN